METKPYSLQSPENIAKDYGGNKQKIVEAMQLGIVDPTAGVLAGMFIDRMRSAQMQEMAPKPTVAQQVMGGPPAQAPLAPAGGLGATAPAMSPMAPGMGAPAAEPVMEEPLPESLAAGGEFNPPYMAGGGLSELPVPDTMFDEDRNGGYANGGIVAFAGAGEARTRFPRPGEYGSFIEELALQTFPGLRVTSRQRSAAKNAQVGGVPGSFHKTGDARDFTPPEGMSMKEFARSLKAKFGSNFDVIDEGDHVHVEPGPKAGARTALPERDTRKSEGRRRTLEDEVEVARSLMADLPDSGLDEVEEYYRKQLTPETKEENRKADMWQTLAQIGASMASTKSPQFLQAAGQAMAEALPGAAANKKERAKAERDAVSAIMEVGKLRRNEAKEVLEFGKDLYTSSLASEQAERALNLQERQLANQIIQAGLDRDQAYRLAKLRTTNPSQFQTALSILLEGTDKEKAALGEYFKMTKPQTGAGNMFGVETDGEDDGNPAYKYR